MRTPSLEVVAFVSRLILISGGFSSEGGRSSLTLLRMKNVDCPDYTTTEGVERLVTATGGDLMSHNCDGRVGGQGRDFGHYRILNIA